MRITFRVFFSVIFYRTTRLVLHYYVIHRLYLLSPKTNHYFAVSSTFYDAGCLKIKMILLIIDDFFLPGLAAIGRCRSYILFVRC